MLRLALLAELPGTRHERVQRGVVCQVFLFLFHTNSSRMLQAMSGLPRFDALFTRCLA
jgi:hypothetical protein